MNTDTPKSNLKIDSVPSLYAAELEFAIEQGPAAAASTSMQIAATMNGAALGSLIKISPTDRDKIMDLAVSSFRELLEHYVDDYLEFVETNVG